MIKGRYNALDDGKRISQTSAKSPHIPEAVADNSPNNTTAREGEQVHMKATGIVRRIDDLDRVVLMIE